MEKFKNSKNIWKCLTGCFCLFLSLFFSKWFYSHFREINQCGVLLNGVAYRFIYIFSQKFTYIYRQALRSKKKRKRTPNAGIFRWTFVQSQVLPLNFKLLCCFSYFYSFTITQVCWLVSQNIRLTRLFVCSSIYFSFTPLLAAHSQIARVLNVANMTSYLNATSNIFVNPSHSVSVSSLQLLALSKCGSGVEFRRPKKYPAWRKRKLVDNKRNLWAKTKKLLAW